VEREGLTTLRTRGLAPWLQVEEEVMLGACSHRQVLVGPITAAQFIATVKSRM
jgi:hypothetical protein